MSISNASFIATPSIVVWQWALVFSRKNKFKISKSKIDSSLVVTHSFICVTCGVAACCKTCGGHVLSRRENSDCVLTCVVSWQFPATARLKENKTFAAVQANYDIAEHMAPEFRCEAQSVKVEKDISGESNRSHVDEPWVANVCAQKSFYIGPTWIGERRPETPLNSQWPNIANFAQSDAYAEYRTSVDHCLATKLDVGDVVSVWTGHEWTQHATVVSQPETTRWRTALIKLLLLRDQLAAAACNLTKTGHTIRLW